ncbi:MAG: OmpA family protein [Bacteroidales bacterium]
MKKLFYGAMAFIFAGMMMATTSVTAQTAQNVQAPMPNDTTIGAIVAIPITMEITTNVNEQMKNQQTELVNGWEIVEVAENKVDTLIEVGIVPDQNSLDAIWLGLNDLLLYKVNSATLSPKAKLLLNKLAANLNNFPETDVTIVGYASKTGTAEYNLDLSMDRAQNVMDYLAAQGVDPTRMKAIGKGWKNPIGSNKTSLGRAENRRVEIWVTANQQMIENAQ